EEEKNEEVKEEASKNETKIKGSNVYVKNIDKLQECFSQRGTITTLELLLKEKGTSNRFGFVCFSRSSDSRHDPRQEHIIVAGAENRPQLLEKSMYDSWASRIRLFIKGKKCGRMMHDSIDNGPLVYPAVEENGQTRLMKYSELTKAQQLQNDYDVQATNIILHGLPPDVYALVNHQEAAKDIWDKGETLYEYYWIFSQLINDMHTIGMTMQQVQVNTKFLNALPSKWSKFFTDVKLAKSLHTTNYDQLVTVQQVQGRQSQSFVGIRSRGTTTTSRGNYAAGQPRVVKCYNYQGKGHMVRECTQPKRPRTAAWFKEKLMLAEAQEAGQILDEEQLVFLADPRISEALVSQQTIPQNSTFQTEDLDAYARIVMTYPWLNRFLIEAPSELPKVSLENKSLEKLKYQLANLDKVVKRTRFDTITDAQSQEKDTVIRKLTDKIKSLSGKDSVENVKKDIDEIETINIELGNSVAKLLSENKIIRKEREHLKSIYKDQFDSIRKTHVQFKEHRDSLISQINAKSVENSDLNAQLQEKVFAIAALKNELRKLKRKNIVDTAVSKPNVTIAPGMFKLYIKPISRRFKNNRDDHETFPSLTKPFEKLVAVTLMNKDKKVRFAEPVTSSSNIPKQTDSLNTKDSNKPLLTSTGVKPTTSASESKPSGNSKNNKIMRPPSSNQRNKVEDHSSKVKSSLNKMSSISEPVIATPTQRILVYSRRPKATRFVGSISKVKIEESKTSNSMEPKQSWGSTVFDVSSSSLNDCRFTNDHIAKIMGYGYYQMGNILISRFYYLEGLGHNLFSVGQFCDSDLEVAFRKHICFIRDLDGVDLLKGSQGSNLYTLSMDNLLLSSPICILSKASKTKSWLWHCRLSQLNFYYITSLAKQGLVRGLSKLKYQKDHLCSACALGKSKKHFHKPKAKDSIQEKTTSIAYGSLRADEDSKYQRKDIHTGYR
nr:integrase, catalytic region, zinc finger, CCHC-type, peptidase aspartic, catalytic [Tanacetum cinerariifolium]